MSESSQMLTQGYNPFLCGTQESPVRLNSFSRHFVGNRAQFLSGFESLNLCECPLHLLYNNCTFLPFYETFKKNFMLLLSKFKS